MPDKLGDMAAEFEAQAAKASSFDPLSEVTGILSAIPDRTLFLEALLATAKRCFLADHAAILSYHRPTDRWFLEASHGLTDDTIEEIKGLSWTVIQASSSKARSLLIADTADHELTRDRPSIRAYNILSVLCTPILGAAGIWGLIYIDSSSVPNAFDKRAEKELERFAEFAGIAIQQCEDIVRLTPRPSAQAGEEADRPFLDFASSKMREAMAVLERAAATDVPVLLVGETGTGKDVLARWVHQKSARRDAPFVQVNCTNIPHNLVESELFGIEGRVASGVDFQEGRLKLADGGTVFLNEIGELPLSIQAKILRVIEDKVLDRVGGKVALGVDVRFICATNSDLSFMLETGRFRRDLYYRINVFETEIPPLRERPEDIPLLATHILEMKCRQYGRPLMRIPKMTMALLTGRDWKGNIRELANLIERGMILLEEDDEFRLDAAIPLSTAGSRTRRKPGSRTPLAVLIAQVERAEIIIALRETGWVSINAASLLGLPLSTLRSKMIKHSIKKPRRVR